MPQDLSGGRDVCLGRENFITSGWSLGLNIRTPTYPFPFALFSMYLPLLFPHLNPHRAVAGLHGYLRPSSPRQSLPTGSLLLQWRGDKLVGCRQSPRRGAPVQSGFCPCFFLLCDVEKDTNLSEALLPRLYIVGGNGSIFPALQDCYGSLMKGGENAV